MSSQKLSSRVYPSSDERVDENTAATFYEILLQNKKNLALVALFMAAAAGGGFFVYSFVHNYFLRQNVSSFDTVVLQTTSSLTLGLKNSYLASKTLSQIFALQCPTVTNWPKCSIYSDMYVKIVKPLVKMGYIRNSALVPMIKNPPTNVDSFEAFAYDFYNSNSFYKGSSSSS
eukprot:gene54858-75162_t